MCGRFLFSVFVGRFKEIVCWLAVFLKKWGGREGEGGEGQGVLLYVCFSGVLARPAGPVSLASLARSPVRLQATAVAAASAAAVATSS